MTPPSHRARAVAGRILRIAAAAQPRWNNRCVVTSSEPLASGRRLLILGICCLSLLLVTMDVTIVNVALPAIQHNLHAPVSGLQWIVDTYTLVVAVLLMLAGSLADRFGRRRVFQVGLVLFTLGSLLCSVAPGLGSLVAFRAIQAVGGSMLNPVAMSIIVNTFTDPRERARAIGVWGGVLGVSLALGPVVGGVLVSSIGWRSIFWINVPIGCVALVLTQVFVPESRAARARRLDPAAQVLVTAGLGCLVYGIIEGPARGWGSPLILGLFASAFCAVMMLVAVESRRREPLIELRFFRSAPFAGATFIAVAAFAALGGFLFLNTLYLQGVRGYSALHAGLLTLPMAVMTGVSAPLSGRLVGARGPRLPLLVAGAAVALGSMLLIDVSAATGMSHLIVAYLILGVGFGMVNAPISNTAVSGMPRAQAGVAAALASTSRQVGASLGVAVTGSLLVLGAGGAENAPSAATGGSSAAWTVLVGCGVAVLVLGAVSTGSWAVGTAARTRRLLEEEEAIDARALAGTV
jgi:EmrB/QacA subfamily drug resistance transporter